jgi:hypothetical protein
MKESSKVTKERRSSQKFVVGKRLRNTVGDFEEMKIDQQHPSKKKNMGPGKEPLIIPN